MLLKRIHEFLLDQNLSFNKFEIALGVSHGSISNAWKRQKNIGSNVIEKILTIYPEIRAEWLLRGEGEMLNFSCNRELEPQDSPDKNLDQELISKTLLFFNLKNRSELQGYFKGTSSSQEALPIEEIILKTWENKYGQELKTIKLQLMTLFTSQLDFELKSEKQNSNSKIG